MNVIPCASIDYFYHDRDSFTESGADSLNLHVSSTGNRTLRTHLGMNISKDIQTTNSTAITPSLRVGWAREYPLDDRGIEASLGDQPDKFVVYSESKITDAMTGGLDIRLSADKNLSIALHYTIEYRHDFLEQSLLAGLNYVF
jgi:fibronectin-binding autotransporter adhesin